MNLYQAGVPAFRVPDHQAYWHLSNPSYELGLLLLREFARTKRNIIEHPVEHVTELTGFDRRTILNSKRAMVIAGVLADAELEHVWQLLNPETGKPLVYPARKQAFDAVNAGLEAFGLPWFIIDSQRLRFTEGRKQSTAVGAKLYAYLWADNRATQRHSDTIYRSDVEISAALCIGERSARRARAVLEENNLIRCGIVNKRDLKRTGRPVERLHERLSHAKVNRTLSITLLNPETGAKLKHLSRHSDDKLFVNPDIVQKGDVQWLLQQFPQVTVECYDDDAKKIVCSFGVVNSNLRVDSETGVWWLDSLNKRERERDPDTGTLKVTKVQRTGSLVELIKLIDDGSRHRAVQAVKFWLETCQMRRSGMADTDIRAMFDDQLRQLKQRGLVKKNGFAQLHDTLNQKAEPAHTVPQFDRRLLVEPDAGITL